MKPLNSKRNRITLILGTFLAFLIIAAPHTARADVCDEGGDFFTKYHNNLTDTATRLTKIDKNYRDTAPTLDIKLHYCYSLIQNAMRLIRLLSSGEGGVFGIFMMLADAIILSLLNQICAALVQDIQTITKLLTVAMYQFICIPMPQLHLGHLNIPNVHSCTGLGLVTAGFKPLNQQTNALGGSTSSGWQIWGGSKTYMPAGQ